MSHKIKKGAVFTGKWFTGRVEVLEVKPKENKLEVKLFSNYDADTEKDYYWFEDWNLGHTLIGFNNGDYFFKSDNDDRNSIHSNK